MKMNARVDTDVIAYGRPFEQPVGRFGAGHVARDFEPFVEIADNKEKYGLAQTAEERRGQIAVADTVTVEIVETPAPVPRLETF